jgi:hypothetical protein
MSIVVALLKEADRFHPHQTEVMNEAAKRLLAAHPGGRALADARGIQVDAKNLGHVVAIALVRSDPALRQELVDLYRAAITEVGFER